MFKAVKYRGWPHGEGSRCGTSYLIVKDDPGIAEWVLEYGTNRPEHSIESSGLEVRNGMSSKESDHAKT